MFVRREDAERFIEEVRGDEPELASTLRIEERELEAGGLNQQGQPLKHEHCEMRLRSKRGAPHVGGDVASQSSLPLSSSVVGEQGRRQLRDGDAHRGRLHV